MPGAKKTKAQRIQSPKRPRTATASRSKAAQLRPPRKLRAPRYNSLRLKKRIKHPVRLASAWVIAKRSRQLVYKNWKVIGGIVLIYGVLNLVLVHGLNGGTDVRQLKSSFDQLVHGFFGHITAGASIFALLLSSSSTTSGANNAGAYQFFLVIAVGLALIWAFRQILAEHRIRVRDAYYRGMYPVVPVLLILAVISLQLLPMLAGGWAYSTVVQQSIATTGLERLLWGALFAMLSLLSFYLISSSLFAIYIATLADMTPMRALRSARELVRHRRWTVVRKVLFLPVWLLVMGLVVMMPIILIVPVLAQWVFYILLMVATAFGHGYMYALYRELLREKN